MLGVECCVIAGNLLEEGGNIELFHVWRQCGRGISVLHEVAFPFIGLRCGPGGLFQARPVTNIEISQLGIVHKAGSTADKRSRNQHHQTECFPIRILLPCDRALSGMSPKVGNLKLLQVRNKDRGSSPEFIAENSTSLLPFAWLETPARRSKRVPNFVSRPNIGPPKNENRAASSSFR